MHTRPRPPQGWPTRKGMRVRSCASWVPSLFAVASGTTSDVRLRIRPPHSCRCEPVAFGGTRFNPAGARARRACRDHRRVGGHVRPGQGRGRALSALRVPRASLRDRNVHARAGGSPALAGAAVYSLQIVLMERYAPRYDAIAFTLIEMLAAFGGLVVVAAALGEFRMPHGWTVWGALVVTGVFASALGYLAQTWAQQRATATQTALAFTLEPVWTAFFGFTLAGDRLGAVAWLGCILIMAGIGIAEPSAAAALGRLVGRPRPARPHT